MNGYALAGGTFVLRTAKLGYRNTLKYPLTPRNILVITKPAQFAMFCEQLAVFQLLVHYDYAAL